MSPSDLVGLDVGQKRTGIARASTIAKLAEPMIIVDTDKAVETLKDLISKSKIEAIVVGLPRNLNGEDTAQTNWVKQWAAEAKTSIELPFYWQDESLTTKLAEARKLDSSYADAEAAAIILQDFLDGPVNERMSIE